MPLGRQANLNFMKPRIGIYLLVLIFIGFSCRYDPVNRMEKKLMEKGQGIAAESFKTLSGQLKAALEDGGIQGAVKYCNLAANPLVDSLSKAHHVKIRRVTFNARNPQNHPDETEKEVLVNYEYLDKQGLKAEAVLFDMDDGSKIYFQPIYIEKALCLICHGNPGSTMTEENREFILSLYPEDEATGYQLNDFRGMWAISFESE